MSRRSIPTPFKQTANGLLAEIEIPWEFIDAWEFIRDKYQAAVAEGRARQDNAKKGADEQNLSRQYIRRENGRIGRLAHRALRLAMRAEKADRQNEIQKLTPHFQTTGYLLSELIRNHKQSFKDRLSQRQHREFVRLRAAGLSLEFIGKNCWPKAITGQHVGRILKKAQKEGWSIPQ